MTSHLIEQLRFTRTEWQRALVGVTAAEAGRRFEPMNSISWIVGHLANQEQAYWFWWREQPLLYENLNDLVGTGKPASTPPLADMLAAWEQITNASDIYLDSLTAADCQQHQTRAGQTHPENIGTRILRVIYHYWFHMGEILAIRQLLGHTDLPQFVGGLGQQAPYQ